MDSILIKGGEPLSGVIPIAGAKNACLTLMPATLLSEEPVTLTNAPRLSDIKTMSVLLRSFGAEVSLLNSGLVIAMSSQKLDNLRADYNIVRKMRASNLVLGPLLARAGEAVVSLPGGCAIGARPMDIHISALEALGAKIKLKDGYLYARAPLTGLKGGRHKMHFASVGATENFLMAASLAKGTSILENAAREPEIIDLVSCLRKMGANIEGEGTHTIIIEGVDRLDGVTHRVICDRIELGTYMLAPAIVGGEVTLAGGHLSLLTSFCEKLAEAGIDFSETVDGITVRQMHGEVQAVNVTTEVFPGFPTDLQAQMMALMCTAKGACYLEETIFENRFMHAPELIRMGADIEVKGGTAKVTGIKRLKGAQVMATDLRASVSLILAGLAAEGETKVNRVYHLDRGYEKLTEKLSSLGAVIERISD
ncbi:MAG: UDP-N-acetylglucosamine 1-carboxyvinyltransferase [Rhodobacteraceae bacterium]|nr:UDP-N-acetylglucosamine 1-carboxyvinyltransferase [Paracoccaceae bacterium]